MRAVGIVAELNPLHGGHLRLLREASRRTGGAPAVVVLSGDFVQRGEAAVFSKFARAEAAVRCGASLVLELPLPWSVASAEGFARGAVGALSETGVVDALAFGSESGDAHRLRLCAKALESPEFPLALRRELSGGAAFAPARQRAVASVAGEETAAVLEQPNDLLAVEYIRVSDRLGRDFALLPVERTGSVHDGEGSASQLRQRMASGEDWLSLIPPPAGETFLRETAAGRGPVLPEDLRLPLLSRLRERTREDFAAAPDVSEGLENLLYRAVRQETDLEAIAHGAKSRRYALSRLRRCLMCAALGVKAGDALGEPPYLRVLAMDSTGAALLREMRACAAVPVITKPAHIRYESGEAARLFALGSAAHDLYVLGYPAQTEQGCGGDYRAAPYIQK